MNSQIGFIYRIGFIYIYIVGPLKGVSGAMCLVQNSLACYVLCKFLFTLLCEIKIGCYAEV